MAFTEEIAKENFKLFREYDGYRSLWSADAKRYDDHRYGTHFSISEEEELLKFGQAPVPVNITAAICDTADAYMNSAKPVINVAPIIYPYDNAKTQNSKNVAAIYKSLLQKSYWDSLGELHTQYVIRDATNVGHGLYLLLPENDEGEFTVKWKHISWRNFYPDPQSKDPFYRDSDNMIYAMVVSEKAGYKLLKSRGLDISWEDYQKDFVKNNKVAPTKLEIPHKYSPNYTKYHQGVMFIIRYSLEEEKVYIVIPKNIDLNRQGLDIDYRTYTKITPELEKLRKQGKIDIREEYKLQLAEYLSVGGLGEKKVYPVDEYNIIPFTYDHRDSPYPLGRVSYLYPLQRALNKFVMVAILNGSLMNSTRLLYERGSIDDVNEFKKNFLKPASMNEWKRVTPNTQQPQLIEAKPLSDAWLTFPKYISYIMEYVSGIFGVMQGDSQQSPDVFSTVASLQSAGGLKIKNRLFKLDATLSIAGKVAGKFYREYAPPQGFTLSINEKGEIVEEILYNQLRAKVDENGNLLPEVEIDPSTDLSLGFKKIRFTSEGSNGYESATEAAMLTTIATQLSIPEIVPLILKRLNMTDLDDVLKKLAAKGDLEAQNKQLQEIVKELDSRTKILANQVQQQMITTGAVKEISKFKEDIKDYMRELGVGENR